METLAIGRAWPVALLDLPFGLACLAGLVALANDPGGWPRRWLERPSLVAPGGISYSLYLVHAPLQHLIVVQVFGRVGLADRWEFPTLLMAGTPLILAIASGFHRVFERPFLEAGGPRAVPRPMGLGRSRASRPRNSARSGSSSP